MGNTSSDDKTSEKDIGEQYFSENEMQHMRETFTQLFTATAVSFTDKSVRHRSSTQVVDNPSVFSNIEGMITGRKSASVKAQTEQENVIYLANQDGFNQVFLDQYGELVTNALFNSIAVQQIHSFEDFERYLIDCVRTNQGKSLEMMYKLSQELQEKIHTEDEINEIHESKKEKVRLFDFCYLMMIISVPEMPERNHEALKSVATLLVDFFDTVGHKRYGQNFNANDLAMLGNMVQIYTPFSAKAFHAVFCETFLRSQCSPSYKPFHYLRLLDPSEIVTVENLVPLALHHEELQGSWRRLYSSSVNGMSFNRIEHHVLGYEGPTCIIIRCNNAEKTILGAFAADRWREHNKFYGCSKNMLFTLSPKLRFYNAKPTVTGKESNYQWLNARAYGLPHGLGMGGTVEGFRFFIPDTLEGCTANSVDTCFEPGLLVPNDKFEIDVLEIWGCGGHEKFEKAIHAQHKNREVMEENIAKARKVDRAQFFNNTFDQEFLLPNTMAHKRESQESSGNS